MRRGEIYEEPEESPRERRRKRSRNEDTEACEGEVFVPLDFKFSPKSTETEREKYTSDNNIHFSGTLVSQPSLAFDELELGSLRETIHEMKWAKPTPIQAASLPNILSGRDLIGISKTGSGKTGAFLIPSLIHILRQKKNTRKPIVLVLSPTRELAQQCDNTYDKFTSTLSMKHCCLYGGELRDKQIKQLKENPLIITATPGRLIDFISSGFVCLDLISFLVIDEADRMLDMGFEKQLRRIIDAIPKDRQTLMFSATWTNEVQSLSFDFLVEPIHIVIGDTKLSANSQIQQIIIQTKEDDKKEELRKILQGDAKGQRVIVFVNTKKQTNELSEYIKSKIKRRSFPLNGDMTQTQRDQSMSKFTKDTACVLVATDVASRGLDVKNIHTIINYDVPIEAQSYIHRIGRTARAEKKGFGYTFFTKKDNFMAGKIREIMLQSHQEPPAWMLPQNDD